MIMITLFQMKFFFEFTFLQMKNSYVSGKIHLIFCNFLVVAIKSVITSEQVRYEFADFSLISFANTACSTNISLISGSKNLFEV